MGVRGHCGHKVVNRRRQTVNQYINMVPSGRKCHEEGQGKELGREGRCYLGWLLRGGAPNKTHRDLNVEGDLR